MFVARRVAFFLFSALAFAVSQPQTGVGTAARSQLDSGSVNRTLEVAPPFPTNISGTFKGGRCGTPSPSAHPAWLPPPAPTSTLCLQEHHLQ
jgi:hypothetical protein